MFVGKAERTKVKNLFGAPEVNHQYYTGLERRAGDKHSSFLRILVNYGRKKFYNIGPRHQASDCKSYGS
jgi:hypothetical protein